MLKTRIIPCLLLKNRGLVKTTRFRQPRYVGDPINAIMIFNEKEVDELVFLDIDSTRRHQDPGYDLIAKIAAECFMPFSYGGGISNLEQIRTILSLGAEKVVLNTLAIDHPELVRKAAEEFGSQSIVVSIDVKGTVFGKGRVFSHARGRSIRRDPVEFAREMEELGAGELMVNSVEREGTGRGYDLELLRRITSAVRIPVVACGGAGSIDDLSAAVKQGGASAVAVGSMFVFYGKHRAVLISYPPPEKLESLLDIKY